MSRLRFWRDHRWTPGRMSAYLDGELTARSRERLERHLADCPECRRLIAGLRQLVAGLNRLPAPESPGSAQIAVSVRRQLGERPKS